MPFTPFHMGPGILIKSLLRGSFSLMIFGWSQILIDLQPLIVMLSGEGHVHGFSHTYVGASLVAVGAAVTGKYLAPIGLRRLHIGDEANRYISWGVALISAFVGTYSHIVLDSFMHRDMQPFIPWSANNPLLGLIPMQFLHVLCLCAGVAGAVIYFSASYYLFQKQKR